MKGMFRVFVFSPVSVIFTVLTVFISVKADLRACKLLFVGERESAREKLLERSFSPDPFSRTFKKY
jgi:hypothetical protein